MASAALGMVIANCPLADDYLHFLHCKLPVLTCCIGLMTG